MKLDNLNVDVGKDTNVYDWHIYSSINDYKHYIVSKTRTFKFKNKFPLSIFKKYKYLTGTLKYYIIGIRKDVKCLKK